MTRPAWRKVGTTLAVVPVLVAGAIGYMIYLAIRYLMEVSVHCPVKSRIYICQTFMNFTSQVQNVQINQIRSENLVQLVVLARGRIMREGCSGAYEVYATGSNNDQS